MSNEYIEFLKTLASHDGEIARKAQIELEKFNSTEVEKAKTDYDNIISGRKGDPTNEDLYNSVIADAKKKFDVYPSAVANAWVVQEYKKRGGKYGPVKKGEQAVIDLPPGHTAADVERHDEGHDKWHAMHGDPPCKSEEDCARMHANYKDDDDTVEKRKFSDKERAAAADSGEAMPDGSYPIKNASDLQNAVQAYGRAKDKKATKKHIKRRAKALGRQDLLPDKWKKKAATSGLMKYSEDEARDDNGRFASGSGDSDKSNFAQASYSGNGEPKRPPASVPDSALKGELGSKERLTSAIKHLLGDESVGSGYNSMYIKPDDVVFAADIADRHYGAAQQGTDALAQALKNDSDIGGNRSYAKIAGALIDALNR